MWHTEPNFTSQNLASMKQPTTISDGEYDEIIRRDHTEKLALSIPRSRKVIQPGVSHFAMLQNPVEFTEALTEFLSS